MWIERSKIEIAPSINRSQQQFAGPSGADSSIFDAIILMAFALIKHNAMKFLFLTSTRIYICLFSSFTREVNQVCCIWARECFSSCSFSCSFNDDMRSSGEWVDFSSVRVSYWSDNCVYIKCSDVITLQFYWFQRYVSWFSHSLQCFLLNLRITPKSLHWSSESLTLHFSISPDP